MDLSIIIPVYNAENFIDRCLNTIFSQENYSFKFEVIAINDGSKDNSLKKLNDWAEKYDNINVVDSENKGAGGARNLGLNKAKGSFIWFIDIDDFIEPGAFTVIENNAIKKNLSIGFNYYTYSQFGEKTPKINNNNFYTENYNGLEYTIAKKPFYLWVMIYKKSIIDKYSIRFIDNIKNIEDFEFNIKYFSTGTEIVYCNTMLYNYYENSSSTTRNRSRENIIKLADDSIIVLNSLKKLESNFNNNLLSYWYSRIITGFCYSLTTNNYTLDDFKHYIKKLKKERHIPVKSNIEFSKKYKFSIFVINRSPLSFYYLLKVSNLFK